MSFTPQQLIERRNWIGASEVAMALGLSPFKTPLQLYREKIGEAKPTEIDPNSDDGLPLEVGMACEDLVIDRLVRRKQIMVSNQQKQYISPELPFVRATVDGEGSDGSNIQAKTAGFMGKSWGDEDSDEIPLYIIYQVQAEMHCSGKEFTWVPAIIGNTSFRVYRIERDPGMWELMAPRLVEFWKRVQTRNPPPPQTRADVKILYPYDLGRAKSSTPEIELVVRDYSTSKESIKRVEADIERLHVAITNFMGPANELCNAAGDVIVTYNTQNGRSYLDVNAVEALYPGLIDEHTKAGDPVRVLRLKKPSTAKKKAKR